MSNAIETQDKLISIGVFAKAATPIFDKLQQNVSKEYTAGSSDTIRVELDGYPIFTDGATVSADSDILIKSVDVTLGVMATTMNVSLMNKAVDMESFDRQVGKPAGVAYAAKAEAKLASEIIFNAENVSVSTGTFAQLNAVQSAIEDTKLGKQLIGFLPPSMYNVIANSGVNLFGQSLGAKMYAGELGNYLGCEYFKSTDLPVIKTGVVPTTSSTVTAAVTADGATQISLGTLSAATGTFKAGTVFALANVFTKNLLGQDTAQPRYFVAKADATVSGSAATVTVAPIHFSKASGVQDPRCNVSVTSIASGTAVSIAPQTANSTYLAGIVFDPAVVAYGAKGLTKYEDQGSASSSVVAGAVSLRIGRTSNMVDGSQKVRLDSMLGFKTVLAKGTGVTLYKVA